jgi:hypothetical protein
MTWLKPKDPHIVYEALSAIADGRFELIDAHNAKCTSTSQGKFYSIQYDQALNSIMSNDNMAYFRDEVSYPMVAMLLANGEIGFNRDILPYLKNIKWKEINQKNKNDYMKSVGQVLNQLKDSGVNTDVIESEANRIFEHLNALQLNKLGNKQVPPRAY